MLILFLSSTVIAQTYIGFKGGINRSKSTFIFNIDPIATNAKGDLDGFYFGVPLELNINDFFNFLPELVIASEGSILSVQTLEEERTYTNAIHYIKLPLIAKLKLLTNKKYEFGLIGGLVPAYAVAVKSNYFTLADLRTVVDVPVTFAEAGINRFDLGLALGLNTEKVIAKGWKIILDFRYHLGILDIENHSNLTNTTENFSLTVGILTPLFKEREAIAF